MLDVAYWFFTPIVTRGVAKVALAIVFLSIAFSQGIPLAELVETARARDTWVRSWPWWVQVPAILLIADLLAYWTHRVFHGRRLWRFHAIHHSSRDVDWLSSVRLHPLNDAAARVVQVVPLYFLGFDGAVLAAFVPFLTLYAVRLHANVRWTFGPLRYVVASPVFHRCITRPKTRRWTPTLPACSRSSTWRSTRSTCRATAGRRGSGRCTTTCQTA